MTDNSERSQTPPASNNRNQPDWCSERYGFVTVPKDGSRDFRKLSDGPWCSWVEAQTKIEQLTRERDEARATVQLTETITARMERLARGRIEAERDRLRALVQRAHTISPFAKLRTRRTRIKRGLSRQREN